MSQRRSGSSGSFELVRSSRDLVRCDAELLGRFRGAWSLSIVELARQAGLSAQAVRNAERGVSVTRETAEALARATGVPMDLIVREDAPVPAADLAEHGLKPPPPPSLLVGRIDLVEEIEERLVGPVAGVVVLSGVSGMGKSAVARRVAANLQSRTASPIVWVDCAQLQTDERILAAMRRIALALGFAARLPEGAGVRAEMFAQSFQTLMWSEPRLLVLDDVPSMRALRLFDGHEAPSRRVLVTTRLRSVAEGAGGQEIRLPRLGDVAAAELLAHYIGVERLEASQEGADDLLDLLAGVPRAIHVAGRVLARERYTELAEFARQYGGFDELLRGSDRVDEWSRAEVSDIHRGASIERFLSSEALSVLGALQIFGPRTFSLEWGQAVVSEPPPVFRRCMAELVDLYVYDDVSDRVSGRGSGAPAIFRRADAERARIPQTAVERDAVHARLVAFIGARLVEFDELPRPRRAERFVAQWECWLPWIEAVAGELLAEGDLAHQGEPSQLARVAVAAGTQRALLPEVVLAARAALDGTTVVVPTGAIMASLKVDCPAAAPMTRARLAAVAAERLMAQHQDLAGALRWTEVAVRCATPFCDAETLTVGRIWMGRLLGLTGRTREAREALESVAAESLATSASGRASARVINDLGLIEARDPSIDPEQVRQRWATAVDLSQRALGGEVQSLTTEVSGSIYALNAAVFDWLQFGQTALATLRTRAAQLLEAVEGCAPFAARLYALAATAGFSLRGLTPEFCGDQAVRLIVDWVRATPPTSRMLTHFDVDLLGLGAKDWLGRRDGADAVRARIYAPIEWASAADAGSFWPGIMAMPLPGMLLPSEVSAELLRRDRAGVLAEFCTALLGSDHPRAREFERLAKRVREAG